MRTWLVWIAVAVVVWLVAIVALFLAGRRLAAKELATLLPNLVRMCRTLLHDPRVPRGSKVLVGLAVVWFVSPIDLVPEFIPVLGPLDDAVLAALVLRHLVKRAGRDVVAEAWPGDPATLERMLRLARVR
ncbi:MAG: YkvA family protein [Actinomycetota bacterium]